MWGGHSRPPLLNLMFALIRAFFVIKGRDCVTNKSKSKAAGEGARATWVHM